MATIIENDLNTDLFPATGAFLSAVHVGETDYKIKDLAARTDILSVAHQVDINTGDIEDLYSIVAGGVTFRGVTEDPGLSDGYQISVISMVGGDDLSAKKGDLVIKGTAEYVWGESRWYELGHYDQFKDLAYHNYTSAAYTPAGGVTVGEKAAVDLDLTASFSGTAGTPTGKVTVPAQSGLTGTFTGTSATLTSDFTGTEATLTSNVTFTANSMSVSQDLTLVGTEATLTGTLTANEISVKAAFAGTEETITGALSGTEVSVVASFAGEQATINASYTPSGDVTVNAIAPSGSVTLQDYTPQGSVTVTAFIPTTNTVTDPTITVTPSAAATGSAAVENETLSIDFGTALTAVSATASGTAVTINEVTPQASFTGTEASGLTATFVGTNMTPTASFTGSAGTATASYTPEGAVSTTKFKPSGDVAITYTPKGTITTEKFTPSGSVEITYTPEGKVVLPAYAPAGTVSISYTPAGSIADITYTPAGSVTGIDVPAQSDVALTMDNFTPEGTVSVTGSVPAHTHENNTFTGTATTIIGRPGEGNAPAA